MDITDDRKAEITYKFNIIKELDKKLITLKQEEKRNSEKTLLKTIEEIENKIKILENNIYSQS